MTKSRKTKRPPTADDRVLSPKSKKESEDPKEEDDFTEVLEVHEGEEITFEGEAQLTVVEGAIIVTRFHIKQHKSLDLHADTQIGGPLVIRISRDKEQPAVPLAAKTTAVLRFNAKPTAQSKTGQADKGFKLQRRQLSEGSETQQAPEGWLQAMDAIASEVREGSSAVIAVAGTKGIGKSGFARLMVNTLLNDHPRVAYLDTDLGQPEFTVPGLVSLHLLDSPILGPPHMHQRAPEACQYLGDTSPQGEPIQCAQAVKHLFDWFVNQLPSKSGMSVESLPPMVVNTHGWIQGVGLQFLSNILGTTSPTHVVMLQSKSARKNLPSHAFWLDPTIPTSQRGRILAVPGVGGQGVANQDETSASGLSSQPGPSMKVLPAIETRGLAWLAFARRCCGTQLPLGHWDGSAFALAAESLAMQPPYTVEFKDIKVQVLHTCVAKELLAGALNCSIVGLACSGEESSSSSSSSHAELACKGKSLPDCLGLGFVRGVNAEQGLLYLLTDLDPIILEQVNILQVGKQTLPPSLMQTASMASPYLSFWSLSSGGSGSGVIKSRNTLARSSHAGQHTA